MSVAEPSLSIESRSGADQMVASLLRMLFVTEVYSAAAFAHMLATYEGLSRDQRRKLEACRRLEVTMGGRILDHLTLGLGLQIKHPPRAKQAGESLAPQRHATWPERMTEMESGSIRGVMGFRTLKGMYGEREPALCATLLAHEMALRDFARDELDGETGFSINRVLALLGPEDQAAVAAFEA